MPGSRLKHPAIASAFVISSSFFLCLLFVIKSLAPNKTLVGVSPHLLVHHPPFTNPPMAPPKRSIPLTKYLEAHNTRRYDLLTCGVLPLAQSQNRRNRFTMV